MEEQSAPFSKPEEKVVDKANFSACIVLTHFPLSILIVRTERTGQRIRHLAEHS